MKNLLLINFLLLLLYSCTNEKISYSETERSEKLRNGEWLSEIDSTSGVLTKKKRIGFFKHMQLTSDSIYHYKIIDSVRIVNTKKDTFKSFLKWTSPYNNKVFYYELVEYDSLNLKIKNLDNEVKNYSYLTKEIRQIRDSILENRLSNHPSFKDSICKKKQEQCFKYNFNKYLNDNINDSFLEKTTNSTENSNTEFILNKKGEIVEIKTNSNNPLVKKELTRLLKSTPVLNSGIYNNKKVDIKYSFSFNYSIKGNEKSSSKSYGINHIYLEKIHYE